MFVMIGSRHYERRDYCNNTQQMRKRIKNLSGPFAGVSVLRTRSLRKRYGTFVAISDVNLDVSAGECFGIIGPNGAGKSTLMRIAAGILSRFEGDCHIFGLDIRKNAETIKGRMGYLPEEPSLYTRPKARDLLAYFARLYGMTRGVDGRVEEMLKLVGLSERSDDRVSAFSKGMRQRLAIARALVHDPEFLMLDEPTMGLDPATADRVRRFILDQRHCGRTILICTHYMDEAELLCDRIGIMDRGRLVALGTSYQIKSLSSLGPERIEVLLERPELSVEQLGVFEDYELMPAGIVGRADLQEAWEALRPNGVISMRRILPTLKDSFVTLTEGTGDSG
jgi:ABC-2 type transport system ATP-binding protein